MQKRRTDRRGFTLVELIIVILLIALLAGLVITATQGVFDRTRKVQAKNDVTQIVTAVNAYYTEYGKYPLASGITTDTAATFKTTNSDVMYALRAVASGANASDALNPRKIVFLSPPQVGDTSPKGGVATTSGIYYDPWGQKTGLAEAGVYHIEIDADYSNDLSSNPYGASGGAGPQPLRQGVIAWSLGKDGKLGKAGNNIFTGSDDVISWQ